ncbi:DNA repair protein RAD16 [Astathelohania contejeani]|uniref:DNA repair protein RAD16 n=1 Tax=Astathelohania contejeani TaxID=164912 RepID=A0ABQ7HXC5_9MICR|nr:DNA repair protein RAD16 [Thelohania contejeani]
MANSNQRIDIRFDTTISSDIPAPVTTFRELTEKEKKKISRLLNEDLKIASIHDDLTFIDNEFQIESIETIPGLKTELMSYQRYGVAWMSSREKSTVAGGILADEMGLGKTVQLIGLLLLDDPSQITLIIVPAVALNQWISEFTKHAPGVFNIISYHGRTKQQVTNILSRTVIITTYGTIENEYRRQSGFIYKRSYHRIVLDEAHIIKDGRSSTNQAVSLLNARMRWALTGTPVQNRVGDLFALMKFLKLEPFSFYYCKKCPCKSQIWLNHSPGSTHPRSWCTCGHFSSSHFSWWNRKIVNPIRELGRTTHGQAVFNQLERVTNQLILRRTKQALERELGLPSRIVTISRNYFSAAEKEFYQSLYGDVQRSYEAYRHLPTQQYAHIFELLQRMRLAVNHPALACQVTVRCCGFCHEEPEDPIQSKCGHIFCREEARQIFETNPLCPVCHVRITIDLDAENVTDTSKPINSNLMNNWTSSTKIECLVEELTKLNNKNTLTKSIVFSQFVAFLEILRWRLERAGFRCVQLYGSMPMAQRKQAIESFRSNPKITVFLISLRAGGVALNLTDASHVFMMDLWWNPAVEEQAMDRIHRIGQHRPIRITRIIIEDSIESRILALQKKKKALFESAVENDMAALGRLTEEDLTFLFS